MVDQGKRPSAEAQKWTVPGPDRRSMSRAITRLAVPMAMADVVALLVLLGIVALMARMSSEALYVRALYLPLVYVFVAIYSGIGISNQVAAAISRGRGRPADVVPIAASFARLWLAASAALVIIIAIAAPALASALDVVPEHRDVFVSFVRWMAPAELTQVGVMLCAASLRGFDHAKESAVVALLTAFVQFGGVAVFGLWLGLGMFTVPASIAAGSLAGIAVGVPLLHRRGLGRLGDWVQWRPEVIGHLVRVGVPVAITHIVLFIGNAGLLWVLGGSDPDVISGFSAAITLQVLLIMPGIVLGSAIAIVLNQQRGAGKQAWMPTGLRTGMTISFGLYAVIALAVWAGRDAIGVMLTSDRDVAAETATYLAIVGLTYVMLGPALAALTSMEQLGAGALAVGLNLTYYLVIIAVGRLVMDGSGAEGVYRTIAVGNLAGVTLVVGTTFLVVRRLSAARTADVSGPASRG